MFRALTFRMVGVAKIVGRCLVLAITLIAMAGSARADYVGFMAPGSVQTGLGANNPVNLGMYFTADTAFSVTSLGIYADPGLAASEQVGLYDFSTKALLASATVQLTDPETDDYLFHAITPVTLTAGREYAVVAFVGNNPWTYGDLTAPIVNPEITYDGSGYNYTNTLTLPTFDGGTSSYYGPNFTIAGAVPEPASLVMLGRG